MTNQLLAVFKNTDGIVSELRQAGLWVSCHITQANFPLVEGDDRENGDIEIVDPACDFMEKEGLALLKQQGLKRPTYQQALRFAEREGKTTTGKKPFIVFLHKPWRDPDGDCLVLIFDRTPAHRKLFLDITESKWNTYCVLAGVRPKR